MKQSEELLFDLEVPESAVAIFWFGQNSFALKNREGTVALIDPYFPLDRPPEKFIHPERPVDEHKIRADVIFLTHDHSDHTCVESIARLFQANQKLKIIGPPESIERIEAEGVAGANLWPVVAGVSIRAASMTTTAVYSKLPDTEPGCVHLGYVIDTGDARVYVSGDPQNNFADVPELTDPVAALSPDIGLLTTHPTEGEFPFFDGSAAIAQQIGLKTAVPSHYGCFAKRTYDPIAWAESFPGTTPERLVIPYCGGAMISTERKWIGFLGSSAG